MKSVEFAAARRLLWGFAFAVATGFAGDAFCVTDPTLLVSFSRSGAGVVLAWAGTKAVPYQVEAGSALVGWTNVSPVLTGSGATLSFTNSGFAGDQVFFRVKRLFPTAPGTATFDAVTGLLTVVADALHTTISVANDGSGVISVNGGAIPISGGPANVANTVLIQVLGSPGDDIITLSGSLPPAHLFGAEGNDTLTGGIGNDMIVGGPGTNTVAGGRGNDVIYPGGNDTVLWNPGDGSDLIQGQGSNNTLVFNGANVSEKIALSANGSRILLTRDVAAITLDMAGVQTIKINALGGADNVVVDNLAGTGVALVNVDLASIVGTTNGDASADTVTINGTVGPDTINVAANAGALEVTELGTIVRVANAELANDRVVFNGLGGDLVNVNGATGADTMQILPSSVAGYARVIVSGSTAPIDVAGALTLSVNALGGPDSISALNGLASLAIPLIFDGGEGDDSIVGGDANDTIIGGAGNDTVSGGRGNDLVLLGDGDDTVSWNPGDGSDTIEGQGGHNTLFFNGANISENFSISANGSRVLLTRDVANITLDLNGIQTLELRTLGGTDNVTISSLEAGTDLAQVNVDLGALGGVGDAQADTVTINATESPDAINVTASAGAVLVTGLAAQVQITHTDPTLDRLIINGLGGLDTISVGPGVTSLIQVTINQ